MVSFLYVLGVICCFGILQTYVIYPLVMIVFGKRNASQKEESSNFSVGIIIAAYNEENVIAQKIQSVIDSNYPLEKISIYVGSDASTDKTNELVEEFKSKHEKVFLKIFGGRMGKAAIINDLVKDSKEEVLILTDANVFFTKDTISNLVRHFSNSSVQQVCANILKISDKNVQIQGLEKRYLWLENIVKSRESNTWGLVIGAEGGCYAIRSDSYTPVPKNFFMDDFFITMSVLRNKGIVLFDEEAICYEDLPVESAEEFKRKIRISIGNFQNLTEFKVLLLKFWSPLAFAFFSHKILRWFTPFLLLILCFVTIALIPTSNVFLYLAFAQGLLFLSPFAIPLVKKLKPALFIAHFYNMNLALLIGFFKYIQGVKSSVWQPTQRTKN
jgi:cellulose synthase/poly-beta-1,6-N-acetylglucosamine synthase-like glycosyltransferase